MTTEMVGFKIEGQFITDFARNRVIEGCWRHALSILSSISGTDHDLSLQILKGERRFVGVNTFKLVDEDPERVAVKEYLEILHYQYAELLYIPGLGSYWRPYGYVSGYGPHDIGTQNRTGYNARPRGWPWSYQRGGQKAGMPVLACGRALHYIDDPREDAMLLLVVPQGNTHESWVMWRRVEDPPLWAFELGAMEDPQEVLDAHFKAGRWFEERGWAQSYGDLEGEDAHWGARSRSNSNPRPLPEPEPIPEQNYDGPPHSEVDVEGIAKFESGWLDRTGRFYPCGYSEHRSMAEHICEMVLQVDLDNLDEEDDEIPYRDAEIYLDKKGWAKRTIAAGGVWLWDGDRLTKAQMNVIMSWYTIRGVKIPFLIKHRLEND